MSILVLVLVLMTVPNWVALSNRCWALLNIVAPFLRAALYALAGTATIVQTANGQALPSAECFSQADTVYEQIFCEVSAAQPASGLPSFWDFKKNNERMQALLLKRPASKLGIALPKFRPSSKPSNVKQTASTAGSQAPISRPAVHLVNGLDQCKLEGNAIKCPQNTFELLGNRHNKHLNRKVFDDDFKLQLPVFNGSYNDAAAVQVYLLQAYQQYLDKMIAIGLGAVTMSYAKFAYFFHDLHSKQVSFTDRFATMYEYLKLDKQNNSVSAAVSRPQALSLADCYRFGATIACDFDRSNYLFSLAARAN